MVNPIKSPIQNRTFPKFTVANKFAGLFVATMIIIGFLQVSGIINLRDIFLSASDKYGVYDIKKEAIIGVPYAYDFSWIKPPECFEPCHFETTAMEGFVPLGLQLWPDGILKGTPTGKVVASRFV